MAIDAETIARVCQDHRIRFFHQSRAFPGKPCPQVFAAIDGAFQETLFLEVDLARFSRPGFAAGRAYRPPGRYP